MIARRRTIKPLIHEKIFKTQEDVIRTEVQAQRMIHTIMTKVPMQQSHLVEKMAKKNFEYDEIRHNYRKIMCCLRD